MTMFEEEDQDNRRKKVIRGTVALVVIALVVAIVLAVTLTVKHANNTSDQFDKIIRYDCHPDQGLSDDAMKTSCEKRSCIWNDAAATKCTYPDDYKNYEVVNITPMLDQFYTRVDLKKTERNSGFSNDIRDLVMEVHGYNDDVVRVVVYDDKHPRWEVPLPILNKEGRFPTVNAKHNFTVEGNELTITRISTGAVIFKTNLERLIFADQFLQLTVNVTSPSLYGFGERQAPHEKSVAGLKANERKVYTFLNHDGVEGKSSYGHHPFYLMYESTNKNEAHGVLFLNSNAMDIVHTPAPALTYRTIGGMLDFLIFMGPTALDVLKQKSELIGRTPMPPYWSLGFHLCRWGYKNTTDVQNAFSRNTELGIPIDTQWVDIDYLDENFNDFTIHPEDFKELPKFVDYLHSINRRFVPILDPSLGYNESNPIPEYTSGIEKDVFVRDDAGELLVTRIWNPLSVIPDFTHPYAGEWWTESLNNLYQKVKYDGIWIDMNEPAATDKHHGSINGCTNNSLDNPQYNPFYPLPVWNHSICFSARHNISRHYDVHNLYGLYEGKVTHEALTKIQPEKRPFILSRATTTGQGSYTNHWLGDNNATWGHLKSSIPGVLDFNLFGIPMVGPDICGFNFNTTEELCTRWSSLGAFYPFSRNHNSNESLDQDPASMGINVQEAARKALNTRYTLLPYLYTLFYHNSVTGEPVARSLKINFPEDEATNSIETQFMWGDGLLINPVLDEGKTSVDAYFPTGVWYDYATAAVRSQGDGKTVTIDIPLTDINIALRGGKIFPTIPSLNHTTNDHKSLPYTILAVLDQEESASGNLYIDNGEQVKDDFSFMSFVVKNSTLSVKRERPGYDAENDVNEIQVWGVRQEVKSVLLVDKDGYDSEIKHSLKDRRLIVTLPSGIKVISEFTVKWS